MERLRRGRNLSQRLVDCQRFGRSLLVSAVVALAPVKTAMSLRERIHGQAARAGRHIVLPEGTEPRTQEAAARVVRDGLARVTLLGKPEEIAERARGRGLDLSGVGAERVPKDGRDFQTALETYRERMRARGVTEDEAREHLRDPLLWGALGVAAGRFDGFVAGAESTTASTLRAALRGIGTRSGVNRVSSFMLMVTARPELGDEGAARLRRLRGEPGPHGPRAGRDRPPRRGECPGLPAGSAPRGPPLFLHPRERRPSPLPEGRGGSEDGAGPGSRPPGRRRAPARRRPGAGGGGQEGPGQPDRRDGPTSSSSRISMPGTSATSWWSESRARARSAPSCRAFGRPANDLSRGCSVDDIVDVVAVTAVQSAGQATPPSVAKG